MKQFRIFLQTNIVRSRDTDKMHFSHMLTPIPGELQQLFILFIEKIQTDIQPNPLLSKKNPQDHFFSETINYSSLYKM